jgi:polyisoprenoid-binding protein YceI
MSVIESTIAEQVPVGTWKIDPAHSNVEFAIKHTGVATVRGRFSGIEGTLVGGESPSLAGTIQVATVDTADEQRDTHLASPDFFDVERYPVATFEATRFEPGTVVGVLTIKGVTREVELDASFGGAGVDPWGNDRIGLDLEGDLDRTDFGLTWNAPLPGGGFLLSDRVKLQASFSLVKEA